MRHDHAMTGAAVAGVVLVAIPALAVALSMGNPGPLHVVVGGFGALLVALSERELIRRLRRRECAVSVRVCRRSMNR